MRRKPHKEQERWRLPPRSDQQQLLDSLLPFPSKASQQEAILKILFARTMRGDERPLTAEAINRLLPNQPGAHGVRNSIGHLRKKLVALFLRRHGEPLHI